MNSILRRLALTLKMWLKALLAPAEDPRNVFVIAYHRQRELLTAVRGARANVTGAREQLEAQATEARGKLPRLQEQARRSLLAGREDHARHALALRQSAVEQLETLEGHVHELEREEQRLSLVDQRVAG